MLMCVQMAFCNIFPLEISRNHDKPPVLSSFSRRRDRGFARIYIYIYIYIILYILYYIYISYYIYYIIYIILPADAVCCPDITIEDVVLSNMIGYIAENTAYTQCFLF